MGVVLGGGGAGRSRPFILVGILAVLVLCNPLPVAGQGSIHKAGTEFQVSTYTYSGYNLQFGDSVCHEPDGSFVVVWQNFIGTGSIEAQRYSSLGGTLGTEFQVNTFTGAVLSDPAVCCSEDGFVVAWAGPQPLYDFVIGGGEIFGQRFDSTGAFRGTEFQINTSTAEPGFNPDLCCSADGDFVVVWNQGSFFEDAHTSAIRGRRYASSGNALGTEFVVNSYTTSTYAVSPGVCCDAAGDFVIAWTRGSNDGANVIGQRYSSTGNLRGTEFQVNTYSTGLQGISIEGFSFLFQNDALCCDRAGDFVVAWEAESPAGHPRGIFGQRFSSTGAAGGAEFSVALSTTELNSVPAICCSGAGDFIVAWQEGGPSIVVDNIGVRAFTHTGAPLTDALQVNTYTTVGPPSISCDTSSGFVVTWFGPNDDFRDGSTVFGQRFRLALLGLAPAPTLSVFGLVAGVVALLGAGVRAFRRRGR